VGQVVSTGLRIGPLGQAKVENLDPAVGGELHVTRLDVPVDDPLLVGGLKGICDLQGNGGDAGCFFQGLTLRPSFVSSAR